MQDKSRYFCVLVPTLQNLVFVASSFFLDFLISFFNVRFFNVGRKFCAKRFDGTRSAQASRTIISQSWCCVEPGKSKTATHVEVRTFVFIALSYWLSFPLFLSSTLSLFLLHYLLSLPSSSLLSFSFFTFLFTPTIGVTYFCRCSSRVFMVNNILLVFLDDDLNLFLHSSGNSFDCSWSLIIPSKVSKYLQPFIWWS